MTSTSPVDASTSQALMFKVAEENEEAIALKKGISAVSKFAYLTIFAGKILQQENRKK